MSPILHQRCIVALLLALWSACAIALMAWGVVELPLREITLIARTPMGGRINAEWRLVTEPLVWAGLGILSLTVSGQWLLAHRHRRATDTSWPWRFLLIATSCNAAWWVFQTLMPIDSLSWYKHLTQAALGTFLFLCVMSERVDVRWGRGSMVCAGCLLVGACGVWLFFNGYRENIADVRVLILLQILPLLLVPAGALNPRYDHEGSRRSECLFMCTVYALTMVMVWISELWHPEFSSGDARVDALWHALPWSALIALCLLLLIPIGRALQATISYKVVAGKEYSQVSMSEFVLDAFPGSTRRSNS